MEVVLCDFYGIYVASSEYHDQLEYYHNNYESRGRLYSFMAGYVLADILGGYYIDYTDYNLLYFVIKIPPV
jgi:hypothetical protein